MGRDTVQLETAVNTISQEYLLEFTSEYGIPEALHPELPRPEDRIVDFLKGKGVPDCRGLAHECSKRWDAGREHIFRRSCENTGYPPHSHPKIARGATLLSGNKPQILPGGRGVKTESRPLAAHEVPLLTVTANRVIEMEDPTAATDSLGVPSTIERSQLDFATKAGAKDPGTMAPEVPPPEDVPTTRGVPEAGQTKRVAATDPHAVEKSRKRGHDGVDANAPLKVLRRDHADPRPTGSTRGGKYLAAIELGMGSTRPAPVLEIAPADVSDPNPLSFADPRSHHPADVAQSFQGTAAVGDPESENTSFASAVAMGLQLRLRFEQEAKLLKKSVAQVARWDKRIQAREREIKNLEALLEAKADMKKVAEDKSAKLNQELENMRTLFSDLQVSNDHLSQQVATLQEQVSGEEKLKAAFEEFKQYEDNRVEQRCAEMDACLDAPSIDFDEELYTHMLTAIAGRRWMIGHGLRLAVGLKDVPMDVIMAALHLENDTGDDAPQWVRELRPSSSQLTIPVYPEVRDPMNLWACKEEMLLADAIAANFNRAEKKKKCRIVCRMHGVVSPHHARSDGVHVSTPAVVSQGLAILLADAAT
nr:hypothetical protein [Tanacetum cinerariifolium]